MAEKPNQKLYMKWWFWVVIGFMFVSLIFATAPYPDQEAENELIICQGSLNDLVEAWDDYEEAMYEYCELDPANLLCEGYI